MTTSDKLREIARKHFPIDKDVKNNTIYNQIQQSKQDSLLSDLTALLEQHKAVMMGFTEWVGLNTPIFLYYRNTDKKWVMTIITPIENPVLHMTDNFEYKEYTTDELFNYWKENEQ